jgi:hypothetical protein
VRKGLKELGLPEQWLTHGIAREVFAIPLVENASKFLRGADLALNPRDLSADRISKWFKSRWLLRRAASNSEWRGFVPKDYRIWGEE